MTQFLKLQHCARTYEKYVDAVLELSRKAHPQMWTIRRAGNARWAVVQAG